MNFLRKWFGPTDADLLDQAIDILAAASGAMHRYMVLLDLSEARLQTIDANTDWWAWAEAKQSVADASIEYQVATTRLHKAQDQYDALVAKCK